MPFKVAARTILQLGAELISSDAIAFYELIKNAFDAKSKRIKINVVVRLPHEARLTFLDIIRKTKQELDAREESKENRPTKQEKRAALEALLPPIHAQVDQAAPDPQSLHSALDSARTLDRLSDAVEEANYIEFEDTGDGMALADLDDVYLTIGTRARFEEREAHRKSLASGDAHSARPVLGEKGVGRLSAMRLGQRLHVKTTKADETNWNTLDINWDWFSHSSDQLLDDVEVEPQLGPAKDDPRQSGTIIRIAGLASAWSEKKLFDIATSEFSKLTDPFLPKPLYPITLRFNGDPVPIERLSDLIFEEAHAIVEIAYATDAPGPRLSGRLDYRRYKRVKTFSLEGAHLLSISQVHSPDILASLGPFSARFYWFNRRILTAVEGIGDLKAVRDLVKKWSGGLMVYRDGFRVYPYGGPHDDWLDLDRAAFGTGGYKVNRAQIVGKVDISSLRNAGLTDQTNREGLRDSAEKVALKEMLRHVLTGEFKTFLDRVDLDVHEKARTSFKDVEERVEKQENELNRNIDLLIQRHPDVRADHAVIAEIRKASSAIRGVMDDASSLAQSLEKGRTQLVHLAGLGLMVEIVAHELNRATAHTLATLADIARSNSPESFRRILSSLEAQLKTIQKRLRILDPLATAGRQTKETFDLVDWVREILHGHEAQFRRHSIRCDLEFDPPSKTPSLRVTMVKGMVAQVIENLLANSVYWLKQQRQFDRSFLPTIKITVQTRAKQILVQDDGPGVDPARREEIFEAFVTTKPPGEGKGLGLYISREIAVYHGASLELSDQRTVHPDKLNTFVFSLEREPT